MPLPYVFTGLQRQKEPRQQTHPLGKPKTCLGRLNFKLHPVSQPCRCHLSFKLHPSVRVALTSGFSPHELSGAGPFRTVPSQRATSRCLCFACGCNLNFKLHLSVSQPSKCNLTFQLHPSVSQPRGCNLNFKLHTRACFQASVAEELSHEAPPDKN